MEARVEKAARMNCDAIEPDNMSVSARPPLRTPERVREKLLAPPPAPPAFCVHAPGSENFN